MSINYNRRKLKSKEKITYIYGVSEVQELEKLYVAVLKNKEKPFTELLSDVSTKLSYNVDELFLKRKIDVIKRTHSVQKGEELSYILLLSKAIENNDEKKKMIYRARLLLIEKEKQKREEASRGNNEFGYRPTSNYPKKDFVKLIREDLPIVLKEKRTGDALYSQGLIKTSQFDQRIKDNIKEIGIDTYLDYVEAVKQPESLTIDELKQLREVLEYFVKNLSDSLSYLSNLDYYYDKEKISSFHVNGEENLKPVYANNANKLLNWKLLVVKKRLSILGKILNSINKILDNQDISSIEAVDKNNKKVIIEETPYLVDDYEKLLRIALVYKQNITSIKTDPEIKKELDTKFKKRMIKEQ